MVLTGVVVSLSEVLCGNNGRGGLLELMAERGLKSLLVRGLGCAPRDRRTRRQCALSFLFKYIAELTARLVGAWASPLPPSFSGAVNAHVESALDIICCGLAADS